MRIGILGGTFDPIHLGHLRVAQEVLEKLHLKQILFLPTGRPPHRRKTFASAQQRLSLVRLAITDHPQFAVSDLEIKRPGYSYTVESLALLKRQHPQQEFFLLLGADQIAQLPSWHKPEKLFQYSRVVGLSRPGIDLAFIQRKIKASPVKKQMARILWLPVSALDISSTDIRCRLRARRSIRYLVPPAVEKYILRHQLYI